MFFATCPNFLYRTINRINASPVFSRDRLSRTLSIAKWFRTDTGWTYLRCRCHLLLQHRFITCKEWQLVLAKLMLSGWWYAHLWRYVNGSVNCVTQTLYSLVLSYPTCSYGVWSITRIEAILWLYNVVWLVKEGAGLQSVQYDQGPRLLTWFNYNPSMDK